MEEVGRSGMKATLIFSVKDGILIYQINKHNGLYDLFQPSLNMLEIKVIPWGFQEGENQG